MQRRQLLALACSFLLIQFTSLALAVVQAKPVPPAQQTKTVAQPISLLVQKAPSLFVPANRKKDETLVYVGWPESNDYAKPDWHWLKQKLFFKKVVWQALHANA